MTPHAHVYSTPWLMLVADNRRRVLLCACGATKLAGTVNETQFDADARRSCLRAALTGAGLTRVADVGALRAPRVHG